MRTGVHCSVRNGFAAAVQEAAALGCQTLQMFTQFPGDWKTHVYTDHDFAEFRSERKRLGIDPVVVHTPYMPNLCTLDPATYLRSKQALHDDLATCERLGAEYLVIHPGAYSEGASIDTGFDRIGAALNEVFERVPGSCQVLIENMAGGGRRIGGKFREIGEIFKRVDKKKRMGVCFDTCHALGAGYDVSTAAGVQRTFDEFDSEVGLENIHVFHVNDSSGVRGCHRDLHQHLGEGHVGLEGLKQIFKNPAFKRCALILETPKGPMPTADLENLKRLRACLPDGVRS